MTQFPVLRFQGVGVREGGTRAKTIVREWQLFQASGNNVPVLQMLPNLCNPIPSRVFWVLWFRKCSVESSHSDFATSRDVLWAAVGWED